MDISRLRKATKIIVPKRIPNFAQKPVYVDIYAQELKFAGDTICLTSVVDTEKKEKLAAEFFKSVQEYYKPPVGIFKRGMREVRGQKPIRVPLEVSSFHDPKLAQPVQISLHQHHIQPKNENVAYDYVKQYLYKDEFNQARIKDCLYLDMLEVQECFHGQGVASKILDKLITHAKRNYGGRFMLTVSTPTNCNNKVPPAIKYWKKGFRFVDETENAIMRRVLNGELPITQTPEHLPMYLLLG